MARSSVAARARAHLTKPLSFICAALLTCSLMPSAAFAAQDSLSLIPEGGQGAVRIAPNVEGDAEEFSHRLSDGSPSADADSAATLSGNASHANGIIDQQVALEPIARAESTSSFCLASTLESTRSVPVVSAKLPLDNGVPSSGSSYGSLGLSVDDPSSSGESIEGSADREGVGEDEGADEPDRRSSISSDSVVVGSFEYEGMTFAIEPGGESVALVAVDYEKLPEDLAQKQMLVIPDMVASGGIGSYSVTRIADGALASLTKERADPAYVGAKALFEDEELLAEAGIEPAAVERYLSDEEEMVDVDGDGEVDTVANPLRGCLGILALGIPSSVASIEYDAFAGSDTLQYLVVSDDNPEYASCDGALYSSDLATLRLIPEGRVDAVHVMGEDWNGAGEENRHFDPRSLFEVVIPLEMTRSKETRIDPVLFSSKQGARGLSNAAFSEIDDLESFLEAYHSNNIYIFRDTEAYPLLYQRSNKVASSYDLNITRNPFGIGTYLEKWYPMKFINGCIQFMGPDTIQEQWGPVALSDGRAGGITLLEEWDSSSRSYKQISANTVLVSSASAMRTRYLFINGFRLPYLMNKKVLWDAGSYGEAFQEGVSVDEGDVLDDGGTVVERWVPLDEASTPDVLENITSVPSYEVKAPEGFTFKGWAAQKKDDAGVPMCDALGNRIFETEYTRYDPATNTTFVQSCKGGTYLTDQTGRDLVIEEDTTFYAVFVRDITFDGASYGGKVQIFDAEGELIEGSFADETIKHDVRYADAVALPQVEEKEEGWTFQGWATKDEQGILSERDDALESVCPRSEDAYYAVWGVDVTWKIDDGAQDEGVAIEGSDGASLVHPNTLYGTSPSESFPVPTKRAGYTFKGWRSFLDGGLYGGSSGASSVPRAIAPTIFESEWEAVEHTISFDVAGGYEDGYESGWSPSSYKAHANLNSAIELPKGEDAFPLPARYGYAFSGWYAQREGVRIFYSDDEGTPSGELWREDAPGTLYAAWEAKSYPVRWMFNYTEAGEAEGFYETTQTFDAPLRLPEETPARPGFSAFAGWFADRAGKHAVTAGVVFAPADLEDRYGDLAKVPVSYYAHYSGAQSFWVKLLAGEGGRFDTSDSSYAPEDSRYAFSPDGTTPAPIIMAGDPQRIELLPKDQHLTSRLTDYVFAGWEEVEGTWEANGEGYRSIADTCPGAVYEQDTTLTDGTIRLANTLKDDTIPEDVMGDRTLRALWRSESVPLTFELGKTSLDGAKDAPIPVFDEDVLASLGFSHAEGSKSASFEWMSPYGSLDLSSLATCEGYRLVGFAPAEYEDAPDEKEHALSSIVADHEHPAASFAGTYVALWEPLDVSIAFHVNYDHKGASSAEDTTLFVPYDAHVTLPYPAASFPEREDGSYGSYAFKWWGTRALETSSSHSAWKADASVSVHEIASQAEPDETNAYHLYAQWVFPVNVTIPLYVDMRVDPEHEWADIIVSDGGADGFLGLQSITRALFKVHSITCQAINSFEAADGTSSPLVVSQGTDVLPEDELFLTVLSEREDGDGTILSFDLAREEVRYTDDVTTLEDGTLFDAERCGLAVREDDPGPYTSIPLRFGLAFAANKDITNFRFADLIADDPTSKGTLARVIYTIEAL